MVYLPALLFASCVYLGHDVVSLLTLQLHLHVAMCVWAILEFVHGWFTVQCGGCLHDELHHYFHELMSDVALVPFAAIMW